MDRRSILLATLACTIRPSGAFAQAPKPAPGVKRIGLLVAGWESTRGHLDRALTEALRQQGYVEGRNLVIERRYAEGDGHRLPELARELEALKLDAVVTTCTPSTRAMKAQTRASPIVMASVSDPVGQGLIASVAKPGGNVTGTSSMAEDILPKMIEYFAAVLPRQAAVAVLADRRNAVHARLWDMMLKPGASADLRLARYEIRGSGEIVAAIDRAGSEGAHGLFVLPDHPVFMDHRASIVSAASRHRMPGMYWAREFVEAGGLMSYGENVAGGWQRSAGYVGRIMHGAKPAELPVSQPTLFELVVNLSAAKSFGIAVPQALLARADRVIE